MERTGAIAVTGASRGIGSAIVVELARRGFTVGCLSRRGKSPEGVEVDAAVASRLIHEVSDVTDEESVRRGLDAVARRAGGLRGVVNNAGIHQKGPSAELPTTEFDAVMRTNATALFVVCREAYPHLVRQGGGVIVNIGSFFDRMGVPRNLAYAASKAAVGAITRCLAVEWARDGIAVVNIAPGYIETDFNRDFLQREEVREFMARRIPLGRTGAPHEVARLVAAVVSEEIPFLTGETIYVDGGQGIAH
jgi:NAD(P)-dependent dehydrogenase (short-subunit alcohol dehydrogenase family)